MKTGDILRIPVDDFFVAAKIIWISQWNKDTMGIVIYPGWFEDAEQVRPVEGEYLAMKMGNADVRVLYPSIKNVTSKKIWTVIGHSPLNERDRELCFHLIGGTLYDGDDSVRNATSDDYARFSPVLAAGPVVVQNLIRQARSAIPRID
ncbi:hypothetical protein E3D03_009895 [Paracoccus sp. DMF]|nr:hypothetical protein [Paracoccus sp. DMF]